MPAAIMSTILPRGRGRSSHRRGRCSRCLGGGSITPSPPCSSFNPLRSLFRCPARHRSRSHSRNRSKHRQWTPSKVVCDAPAAEAAGAQVQQQTQEEEEPSFFVYAMPNHSSGFGVTTDEHKKKKKKKHRKPHMPSFGSCFRSRKKKAERKQAKSAATTVSAPHPALTPASSLLTHPPGSPPAASETKAHVQQQAVTPAVTQPPSPAPTENGSTGTVNDSPAPPTGAEHSTISTRSPPPFAPRMQPKQVVEGLEIVEVATGERLSAHELGLIEMVGGSSTDNSVESSSSAKSSLDYVNEPQPLPPAKAKRTVVEKGVPKLWLNGKSAESRARERVSEPPVAAAAAQELLGAHDVACSRVHAIMLAETVSAVRAHDVG